MLITRIRTAAVALPLFLAALFLLPTAGWALFLLVWLLIGAWEWAALAKWPASSRAAYVVLVLLLTLAVWIWVVAAAHAQGMMLILGVALVFWLTIAPLWLARGWHVTHPLLFAAAGIVVLLPMWLALVQLQLEPGLLLTLMATIWVSDSVAYFCGRQWGRHKLAPAISPGKTWEGVAGALAGVALYYAIISVSFPAAHGVLNGASGLAVFAALTLLGVEGDLFESWIKRTAGVKDSGSVLPGHGGILDRVDALTPSMPAAALLLAWFA
jgi:phosphatidate cytidylyltransferase